MALKALETYLEDHLAGAASAVDLLKRMQSEHDGDPLGRFAGELLEDVVADRRTLEDFSRRVGSGPHPFKEAATKVAEKAARFKLSRRMAGPLGLLESLEFLALGIWGKRALWLALSTAAPYDMRIRALGLPALIERAESQHARVEQRRLEAARATLAPASSGLPDSP
jgi:hypothetical protein